MVRKPPGFAPAVGILFLASTAGAAVKTTPALQKGQADYFVCRVLNAGPKQLSGLALRIHDSNGSVLAVASPIAPSPGSTTSVAYFGNDQVGYCTLEGAFARKRALLTFCAVRSGETICENAVGDPGL